MFFRLLGVLIIGVVVFIRRRGLPTLLRRLMIGR
jgi:hypothetical protein